MDVWKSWPFWTAIITFRTACALDKVNLLVLNVLYFPCLLDL